MIKLLALTILTILTGCASVVSDSNYDVKIDSYPRGADITIKDKRGNNVFTGQTPELLSLDSGAGFFQGETYTIEYTKDGYNTSSKVINSEFDAWVIGNIFIGGLGGIIIDGATGAMWKLEQPSVKILRVEDGYIGVK